MEVVKMLSKLRIADFRYKCNALLKTIGSQFVLFDMFICLQILRTLKVMRQIPLSEERDHLG